MPPKIWIKKETSSWVKEGIINSSQANAILARYKLAKPGSVEDKHSKLVFAVSVLGALLIGLGMMVFVASNWQAIPAFLKLGILYGTTFTAYFAGWKIGIDTKKFPKLGDALLFLGSIMVGVTLALTAQIFNIEANFTRFFLIWFIAIAPLSYGFKSRSNLILSLLLFGAWLSAFMSGSGGVFNLIFGFFEGFGVFLFYGITLYGIGYLHDKTKFENFKGTYQSFGLFYTLLILYTVIVSELQILEESGLHWLSYVFLATAFLTVVGSAFCSWKSNLFNNILGN